MKPAFDPAHTIAVVVGVERYAVGDGWALSGPALDAVTFVEWLRARDVPTANIHLYLSPLVRNVPDVTARLAAPDVDVAIRDVATTGRIIQLLHQTLFAAAADTKLLYVFWGGHGAMESDQERRLFCGDAVGGYLNPINLPSLLETLRTKPWVGIREQIVIVDACANYYEAMKYRQPQAEVRFNPGGYDATGSDQLVLLAAASGEAAGNDPVQRSGDFSRRVFHHIAQTPLTEWPDFTVVAQKLVDEFQARTAAGDARQHPVAMRSRRGTGSEDGAGVYPVSGQVQSAAGEGDVGIPQLRSLVSLALAESSLGDAARRDAVVEALPAAVRGRITRQREDAESDLLQIFAFALGSEQHARELRRAIEVAEPDAASRDELVLGIERLRLAVAVRARIGSAVMSVDEMRTLYKRCAPDPQRAPPANTLDEMLEHLQDFGARAEGSLPPVVEFVERVAQALGSADLAQWVTAWSTQTTGGAQAAVQLRQWLAGERAAARTGQATLYVDASEGFRPTTNPGQPLRLRFWVYDSALRFLGSDTITYATASGESVEAAARRAMADVLQQASALMESANETTTFAIELFVTMEQLLWDFDEWKLYLEDEDSPTYGISYPLTLRWVERARSQGSRLETDRRNAWKGAAKRIRERVAGGDPPSAFWVVRDGSQPPLIETKVKTQHYGSYVALQFVPAFDQASDLERRLLCAVLRGGAPFAIWRRSAPAAWPALQQTLDTFLGAAPFDELPQRCVALRQEALGDATTAGHSLAILWDDPDRNPLDILLSHLTQRTP